MQDKMRFNVSLFFLLCFVLVFGHALQGSFVYDDPRWIEHNRFIRDWANVKHFFSSQYFLGSQEMSYRPVTTISYMLDFSLFGLKPFGYRLHNLLLHWMVCALLWRVLADMTQSRIAAWWATFLFCFHPINVEAVVVPSLREEMQCAIFVLISWRWLWRPGRWVLGTIAFAVALLAKETALFFPILVVMALLDSRGTCRDHSCLWLRALPLYEK
jgi:protein O-mannosyl-transferase